MKKTLAALCGAALIAGCASAPVQRSQTNSSCDYALMDRIDSHWQPTLTHRYWVNCPQIQEHKS